MKRHVPDKVLPHRDLVTVSPFEGGGADGRTYGAPVTIKRALISDSTEIVRDQYDAEAIATTTVFFERDELNRIPTPETKVTLWAGTEDERDAYVIRCARHEHPKIADLLEVKLR